MNVLNIKLRTPFVEKNLWVGLKLSYFLCLKRTLNVLLNRVNFEWKGERGALSNFGPQLNASLILLDNLLRNCEAKANSIFVMELWLLEKAKKLEKFLLVFLWDANTSVSDLNLKKLVPNPDSYVDLSVVGELKSIAL